MFARRWVVVTTVLVLLSGTTSAVLATWPADPCHVAGYPMARAAWLSETEECIGYSAGGFVFGEPGKLTMAQQAVFEQNAEAERLHRDNPDRPVISLVYFAELTHPKKRQGTDDAEAEELTGHDLPKLSPLYLQMVAGNAPQASLITDYAASEGRSVTVYHPDFEREPDQYLRSLHDQFEVRANEYRSDDFAGISIGYVSLASRIVLAGSSCFARGVRPGEQPAERAAAQDLLRAHARPLPPGHEHARRVAEVRRRTGQGRRQEPLDRGTGNGSGSPTTPPGSSSKPPATTNAGRVAGAGELRLNRTAVAHELRELDCAEPHGRNCFKGVSGHIDFRTGRDGSNRPLAILTIHDISAVDPNPTCTYRSQDAPCP